MRKLLSFLVIFLIASLGFSAAMTQQEIQAAKKLIDTKASCSNLSDEQLELIGDYEMELMHPGQAHDTMEQMMGGEGSESLRLMHISMAERIHCKEPNAAVNFGMMGYGMMGSRGSMMGGNIMNNNGMIGGYGGMMNGYGMMGNYGSGYWSFSYVLYILLLLGLIVLVLLGIVKLWKDINRPHKK